MNTKTATTTHSPVIVFALAPPDSGNCATMGCTCGYKPATASPTGSTMHLSYDAHLASLGLPKTFGNIVDPPWDENFRADKRAWQATRPPESLMRP